MVLGRLAHYALDAVLVSTVVAGVKRTSGFAPDTSLINDPSIRSLAERYLGVGESVFDMIQAITLRVLSLFLDPGASYSAVAITINEINKMFRLSRRGKYDTRSESLPKTFERCHQSFEMAPKKGKKISLNEFLGDNAFGSWADEMEDLPTAPAARPDGDQPRAHERFAKKEDAMRVDRSGPPREDVPLPTRPPYTAFIGNLSFDLTETELQNFFVASNPKSAKIIRDREDKPKGFGYVEFEDLDGLKDGLAKSGSNLAGRIIRVSVAEPPKERNNISAMEDSSKFEGPWRRDGPLPDIPERESSRRRFDGVPSLDRTAASDQSSDWRSNRVRAPEPEAPPFKRKGPGFPISHSGQADKEETWSIGSKFKPSDDSRTGNPRTRETGVDEPDWRSSARPKSVGRHDGSPTTSTPPTPQMGRRKLELLPRSGNDSSNPSPMSSPKMSPATSSTAVKSSPFGEAKPVDVSHKNKEVSERLEREREAVKERFSMSRTSSRGASERTGQNAVKLQNSSSQKTSPGTSTLASNVRPLLSFANVAASKGSVANEPEPQEVKTEHAVEKLTDMTA